MISNWENNFQLYHSNLKQFKMLLNSVFNLNTKKMLRNFYKHFKKCLK